MEYQISKVYNNNVVLAKHGQREVVLVSKGIGFGRKSGDTIHSGYSIEKVFHEIDPDGHSAELDIVEEQTQKIKQVTRGIVALAEEKLGTLNEHSEKAMCEHIEFAVERLRMGIAIENPFIDEIISLYRQEYEVAIEAGVLVKELLDVELGEEEEGFIALHLYSARRNKSIKETMKLTRVYRGCIDIIESEFNTKIPKRNTVSKEFLRSLRLLLRVADAGKSMKLDSKKAIARQLKQSSKAAHRIAEFVQAEKGIVLSDDIIGFLTIDIERLIQLT